MPWPAPSTVAHSATGRRDRDTSHAMSGPTPIATSRTLKRARPAARLTAVVRASVDGWRPASIHMAALPKSMTNTHPAIARPPRYLLATDTSLLPDLTDAPIISRDAA